MSDDEVKLTTDDTTDDGKQFPKTPKPQIIFERFSRSVCRSSPEDFDADYSDTDYD